MKNRKSSQEFPQELWQTFDRYVHGDIDRRAFFDGLQKFAVGGLTVTALFEALMQNHVAQSPIPSLPDNPVDPEAEMTVWVASVLGHMRENRVLIRTSFGEIEERPDAAVSMCEGPNCAGMILTDYVLRLQSLGLADPDGDIQTVVAMLMSSMFGDAISRDVMPNTFPQPESEAPRKYVRAFMRALGVTPAAARHVSRRRSVAGD